MQISHILEHTRAHCQFNGETKSVATRTGLMEQTRAHAARETLAAGMFVIRANAKQNDRIIFEVKTLQETSSVGPKLR